ncbi:MAG: hypothetical protein ACRC8S_18790 [Fimbriiglobus sp.]
MEADAIDSILQSLQPTTWGWFAAVPGEAFLGQPVSLRIDTRDVPTDEPPPAPNPGEVALARLVLAGLTEVLAQAEEQYRTYHREVPDAVPLAHEPHVWLSRSGMALDGADRWQFVVGIQGSEDYGTHAEFTGVSYVGIWSGD